MKQTEQSTSEKNRRCFNLTETTVIDLDGVRVGLANVWEESFEQSNSSPKRGVRGTLCLMYSDSTKDYDIRVATGDKIVTADKQFLVTNVSEGSSYGSLTLEEIEEVEEIDSVRNALLSASNNVSSVARLNWVNFLLPIPFLCLPYAANSETSRAILATVCLILWLVLIRPNWKGLQGFYATVLLLVHCLFWIIAAAYICLFR